ncbi:MAG: Glu/Leu/Phe/Val family dehydrogenase [Myxococcota bacterium]
MMTEPYDPYLAAQRDFDRFAAILDLDSGTRALLRQPLREVHFSIPVRMDDGKVEVFRGFRVQHNDARGPAKGGVRLHPQETIDAVRALAMGATWQAAVSGVPLGGARGGVACDPHGLSSGEQERLCRGWVRQMARHMGPNLDVPGPDLMVSSRHMLWMLDEYEVLNGGARTPGAITGKPVDLGGSLGRREATGYGLVYVLREVLRELGRSPRETAASVQGFGSVAQHAIELFQKIGGTVKAVSSWDRRSSTSHTFVGEEGVNLEQLRAMTDPFGSIDVERARALGYRVLPGEQWLALDVDLLIPAAMENQIGEKDVSSISSTVAVVAEGADSAATPKAAAALEERGILLVPDFLANAGGLICSYFEQVQSNANYQWEKDEVLAKLDTRMTSAYRDARETARRSNLSLRDAALLMAIQRVAQACRDRGWA